MPNNYLITGPPGSGKTSVIERTIATLRDEGFEAGGIYCPEIRRDGLRMGFNIVDVMTGESRILAHVDQQVGPRVSKYRVNVANVDELSEKAIGRALERADFLVIDEIAPMEIFSEGFKRAVVRALDSAKPLLAVIHQRSNSGFIGEVKARPDVRVFEVGPGNRETLHLKLAGLITGILRER